MLSSRRSAPVDTDVLSDVLTDDPRWGEWSSRALSDAADRGRLIINPVIYAKIPTGFDRVEDLDNAVPATDFVRESLPWTAGFLAGKAFMTYRRRGGERRSPLPDFDIGAHAVVGGHRLLTRDAARYRTYFSTVELHAPS